MKDLLKERFQRLAGIKPLYENIKPTIDNIPIGFMNEAPATCAQILSPADALIYCHEFEGCIQGAPNGIKQVYMFGLQSPSSPGNFYDVMCPGGCSSGDAVEASNGNIYVYGGINVNANTQAIGPINLVGPTTCVLVNGCMDSTATNYDPSANVDDGSCFHGYNCRRQTTPQDVGFKKAQPGSDGGIREWAGTDMCFEAAAGTTGTYPDLASCKDECGPRRADIDIKSVGP